MMEQRIYHGTITPKEIAQALMGEFNRGHFRAQAFGNEKNAVIQITTKEWLQSGGQTALSVTVKQVEDGVSIEVGKQSWLGVAASIGQTLFSAVRNPWNIVNRLDDIAQDVQSLQLTDDILKVIADTTRSANATFELSERFRRISCEYCDTANPIGASSCIACGAPLGETQPHTCSQCGFVLKNNENRCPNCGHQLS
jgi:hypothetical protein